VLILGGHHAGRDAARVIPDTRGHVVAALAYPYRGTHKPRGTLEVLRIAPAVRRASVETPLAVRLALDWLLAQPWVDTTRVEAVGASLGVPFMSVAAATDLRITRLWAVHGAGRSRDLLAHNARPFVPTRPLRALAARAADALVAGERLTAERWIGRVAPRPVVLINAEEDERLPRPAILACGTRRASRAR
jgi:dienelactone hydrolase